MIQIDFDNYSYICPFCGHAQAYLQSHFTQNNGRYHNHTPVAAEHRESSFTIHTFECQNAACKRISVTAINRTTGLQIDIVPQVVFKHYPEYIPEQIRSDYKEANLVISRSPKAAATLLRRCLQGMIHDFWGIHEKNLNAEITALNGKIPTSQWQAIDALRKVGNIGAHMENDVNIIIDIDESEADKLLRLVELLFEKWYIARHDEEKLLADVVGIAEDKSSQRNG